MKYESIEYFIKKHIRFKQHWNKKVIKMTDAVWQPLSEDTYIDGQEYAAGSMFKVFETTNFGWIVFDGNTKCPNGNIPNRRIIKW